MFPKTITSTGIIQQKKWNIRWEESLDQEKDIEGQIMRWYVIQSKPQKEKLLSEQLSLLKIDVYYPCIRVHPSNPRARQVRPYFPRYLFTHMDPEDNNINCLRWMPGAVGLVSCDGKPASVPDNVVNAIHRRVDEINEAGGEFFDSLKTGDPLVIHSGPLAGYEALFSAYLPGLERVRVLLNLLKNRHLQVDLPAGQVHSKK
jgi:transcription antitermination factor NusG